MSHLPIWALTPITTQHPSSRTSPGSNGTPYINTISDHSILVVGVALSLEMKQIISQTERLQISLISQYCFL